MSINVLNRKLLWGRAGNRCAYDGCDQTLTVDLGTEESEVLSMVGVVMGEEAHIRSARPDGPRHDPQYDSNKLDTYENLLLLCPTHHTLIDKNGGAGFSVETLQQMKLTHERRVTERLGQDGESRRELSERMAALLFVWDQKMPLETWERITSELNQPIPRLPDSQYTRLVEVGSWLLRMRWPDSFPRTVRAFRNLHHVFGDLLNHLQKCMVWEHDLWWMLRRRYKDIGWNPGAYKGLFAEFQTERFTLYVLAIEATKAINWVIAEAANEVDRFYRFDQGLVLMGDGDGVFKSFVVRLEYDSEEVGGDSPEPYPGIEEITGYLQVNIFTDAHFFEGYNLAAIAREIRQKETNA
ncbi:HNH endonuclease [Streptomyces sp. NPDC048202]|uniref:HNH endonuclease n=1 Tax=Streptomyces sp. NPDC048202 TaxID=3365514 RepID=UPI003720BBAF